MTSPRFWTDPLDGINYTEGQRVTSAQMNAYLAGLRNIDLALERSTVLNWPHKVTAAGANPADDYTMDPSLGRYVVAADDGANPVPCWSDNCEAFNAASSCPAGAGLTACAVTNDGAGTFVMGGTPGGASQAKIRTSSDGDTWASQNMSASCNGAEGVTALCWDAGNSLFFAGLDGGTPTKTIETSPDGVTWTSRTSTASNQVSAIASNGSATSPLIVVVSDVGGGTNVCETSSNGASWTARVLTITDQWKGVAYCAKQGKWMIAADVCAASGTIQTSTDGATWSAVTPSFPDGGGVTTNIGCLTATENYFILSGYEAIGGTNYGLVYASADAGATWEVVTELDVVGGGNGRIQYQGGQLLAVHAVGSNAQTYASQRFTYT